MIRLRPLCERFPPGAWRTGQGSVALKDVHHLGAAFVEALLFLLPHCDALFGGIEFSSEIVAAVADDGFVEGPHLVIALDGESGQGDARLGIDALQFIDGWRGFRPHRGFQVPDGCGVDDVGVGEVVDLAGELVGFRLPSPRIGAGRGSRPTWACISFSRASATVTWVRRSDALPMMLPKAPAPAAFLSSASVFSRSRTFCQSLAICQSRPSKVKQGHLVVADLLHGGLLFRGRERSAELAGARSRRKANGRSGRGPRYRGDCASPNIFSPSNATHSVLERRVFPFRKLAPSTWSFDLSLPERSRRNLFPAEVELHAKRFTDERFRAEKGILSGIRAGEEMDDLDQAGLARPVAGLLVACSGFLLRDQDIQAGLELQPLEGRQAAEDAVNHGVFRRRRPS